MKIIVSIPAFREAVARAQGVIDGKTTLPILSNLLLAADGDEGTVWLMESSLTSMEKSFTRFLGQNKEAQGPLRSPGA